MSSVKNAITDLSSLKTLSLDKAARAESGRTDQQIQRSQIKAAESRIGQAEASVQRYDIEKSKAEDKLSPPPTKTVAGDGKKGGSKTVVDEREKDKLQAQVRAADLQVQQAQAAVGAAQTEAEDMKGNVLVAAGLTEQQGADMGNLQSQIDELESLANDDQTDLTGEGYQDKLLKAKADTERLAETLPDTANAALSEFWEDIGASWGNIQDKMTDFTTVPPAEVKKTGSDYSEYFTDLEQGFDSIIDHLEANGETREVVSSVKSSKNLILGKDDYYLGGMSSGDDASLSALLTHMNGMIKKMGTEGLTAEDIANLNILGDETHNVIATGGRSFESAVALPFNTAAENLDAFSQNLQDNDAFADMYTRFNGLYNGGNTFGQLQGITNDEVDQAYQFSDLTDTINEIYRDGGNPSEQQLEQLTTLGNSLADNLENNYGFNSADTGGGDDNGLGSRGNRGRTSI